MQGVELGRYRPGDEEVVLPLLAEGHPHSWGRSEPALWHWKHPEHPAFRADDVVLARAGERVVGCFHGTVLPLRLAPGVTVFASYDGDYAVHPDARGQDLTGRAYALTDPELVKRGVSVRGGFTSRELNERHYGKKYGYVFVRTATGQFRKMIGLEPLRVRIEELGRSVLARPRIRRALEKRPIVVKLSIDGLPEGILHLRPDGFRLEELSASHGAEPDLSLAVPYPVIAVLPERPLSSLVRMIQALVLGRARVRGIMIGSLRLAQLGIAAFAPPGPRPGR